MRTNEAGWLDKYNRWQIKVQKEGMRKTFTSSKEGTKGKIECEKKADKWLEGGASNSSIRFGAAYEQFLEFTSNHTGTSNTNKHKTVGKCWFLPKLKHKKVASITTADWQQCIDLAYKSGLSKKTLENIRGSITAFRTYCQKAGIEITEFYGIIIPNNAKERKKIILQPDEFRQVMSLTQLDSEYIYAFQFFITTGLRPGELCGLEESDIDGAILHIQRSYNTFGEFTQGKTRTANREFILSSVALSVLENQRKLKKQRGLISPYVFPNLTTKKTMRSATLARYWKMLRDQIGVKSTLYELRHTFMSINKANVPEELMKLIVGHTKNMDTYGVYGHKVSGDIEKAAALVERSVNEVLNNKSGL